ncbi:hypothetical protein [Herbaspirillum huttiense]|uniref:hypothetical protein n=1 Tax=Herbaspirillum huttiense TaxID=863372 RepID=UPI0039AF90BC
MKKRNFVIFFYHSSNNHGIRVASSPNSLEISMRKFLQRTILSDVSAGKCNPGCAGRMTGSRQCRAGAARLARSIQAACTGPGLSA